MIRVFAVACVLMLSACDRKPPGPVPAATTSPLPAASSPVPPAKAQGAALIELIEENTDEFGRALVVNDQETAGIVDRGDTLVVPALAPAHSLRVVLEGAPDTAGVVVLVRSDYGGKGRTGGTHAWHVGGASLVLRAPPRPGARVGGGVKTSLEAVLSRVRLWPGDLTVRREGDRVIVAAAGKQSSLAPGEEAAIADEAVRCRVLEEVADLGQAEGTVVIEGVRRIDRGECGFRTRLRVRHLGIRALEVLR